MISTDNYDNRSVKFRREINIKNEKYERRKEKRNTLILMNPIDLNKEKRGHSTQRAQEFEKFILKNKTKNKFKIKKEGKKEEKEEKEEEQDQGVREEKTKKNKNKNNIKYIILIILLIISIIFLVFIIIYFDAKIKGKNDNENKCADGFFFPSDGDQCQKCTIENCGKCIGNKFKNFCIFCLSGYTASYDNDVVVSCHDYNIDDNCDSFDKNENKCKSCKEGYFLAFFNENTQKCQKCDIENCENCFGVKTSYVCTSCKKGYYIPDDDETKQTCKACSLNNCESCIGTESVNYCYACKENYTPTKVNNVITQCV